MRLFFLLVVAALETTAVSLPLAALTGLEQPWWLLMLVVCLGVLTDQLARRGNPGRERATLLAGATICGLLLPALRLGGPGAALAALLPGSPAFVGTYALLLVGLFLFWRGSRLAHTAGDQVGALFAWGATAGIIALILGAMLPGGTPTDGPVILAHTLGLVGLGLLSVAIAHAQTAAGERLADLSWRWLATLGAAVAGVLALAVIALALFGGGAAATAASALIGVIVLPLALVGAAIAWVVITYLGEPLRDLLRSILARLQLLQQPQAPPEQAATGEAGEGVTRVIERMAEGATLLLALIPVAIIVAAILLLRRRGRPRKAPDEERASLDLGVNLRADLRELLGRLRNPFRRQIAGLRLALASLGNSPSERVRRAYIGLLLLLEERERPRPPALTPAEFGPEAATATGAPEPVGALTTTYERARYNPAGAAAADAAAAEAALERLRGE